MLCGYLGRVSAATAETDARLSVGLSVCPTVGLSRCRCHCHIEGTREKRMNKGEKAPVGEVKNRCGTHEQSPEKCSMIYTVFGRIATSFSAQAATE